MDKSWQSMAEHLADIGFMQPAIAYIIDKLDEYAKRFGQSTKAIEVLSVMFAYQVDNLFSERELDLFLKGIDPYHVSDLELEQELGLREDELDCLDKDELEIYYNDRLDFIIRRKGEKTRDLSILENEESYAVLRSRVYRRVEPADKLPSVNLRPILTPMGGQVGYRRRFTRR